MIRKKIVVVIVSRYGRVGYVLIVGPVTICEHSYLVACTAAYQDADILITTVQSLYRWVDLFCARPTLGLIDDFRIDCLQAVTIFIVLSWVFFLLDCFSEVIESPYRG